MQTNIFYPKLELNGTPSGIHLGSPNFIRTNSPSGKDNVVDKRHLLIHIIHCSHTPYSIFTKEIDCGDTK